MELIELSYHKPSKKIAVGDRVKIKFHWSNNYNGKLGTLIQWSLTPAVLMEDGTTVYPLLGEIEKIS